MRKQKIPRGVWRLISPILGLPILHQLFRESFWERSSMDRRRPAGTGIGTPSSFPDDHYVDAGKMPAVHKAPTIFGALEKLKRQEQRWKQLMDNCKLPGRGRGRESARLATILLSLTALTTGTAHAVDHNNLDAGRPLDFDDAYSIAYREQAVEFGVNLSKPKTGKTEVGGKVEYLYGFAKNSHLSIDMHPHWASEDNGKRRFDRGDVGIGVFHNFNREHGNTPALALRADAYLPTGRDSEGVDYRLRAIATKQVRQYGRLHVNLDLNVDSRAPRGQRSVLPGVILGYSQPIGYPTRFDRTLLAQVGYRVNPLRGEDGITTVGLGLRQQIGVTGVLDVGVLSDLTGGSSREKWKLTVGYSRQF